METLKKISAEIIKILSGGTPSKDSEYDERYIAQLVRSGMNEALKMEVFSKRQTDDDRSAIAMYIATYTALDVKKDPITERYYTEIPGFYVSLPYNKGIRQISPVNKDRESFVQKLNPSVTETLHAGKLQGRIGFYIEGYKAIYDETINQRGIKKVNIKLIVAAPENLGMDDPLPILPEHKFSIIEKIVQTMRNDPIQDTINDENKDVGVKIK